MATNALGLDTRDVSWRRFLEEEAYTRGIVSDRADAGLRDRRLDALLRGTVPLRSSNPVPPTPSPTTSHTSMYAKEVEAAALNDRDLDQTLEELVALRGHYRRLDANIETLKIEKTRRQIGQQAEHVKALDALLATADEQLKVAAVRGHAGYVLKLREYEALANDLMGLSDTHADVVRVACSISPIQQQLKWKHHRDGLTSRLAGAEGPKPPFGAHPRPQIVKTWEPLLRAARGEIVTSATGDQS